MRKREIQIKGYWESGWGSRDEIHNLNLNRHMAKFAKGEQVCSARGKNSEIDR